MELPTGRSWSLAWPLGASQYQPDARGRGGEDIKMKLMSTESPEGRKSQQGTESREGRRLGGGGQ